MAIKINRSHQFTPTWQGNDQLPAAEQVSVSYNTLNVDDMFEVQRQTGLNLFAGVPMDVKDADAFQKSWQMCRYLIEKYTTGWVNIEVGGEKLSTGKQVLDGLGASCLDLFIEVAGRIFTKSMGNEDQVKNSASQSEPESEDSASTAPPALPGENNESGTVETST